MEGEDYHRLREFYLEEIAAWERGDKATIGQPATGENYACAMRENRKRLLAEIEKLDNSYNYPIVR